jgi:3-mercaptopyruvate sulfurtransferase SseA
VLELNKLGREQAGALLGGWDAWVKAGLPTEVTNEEGMLP